MIKKGDKICPFCGGTLQPRGHVKRKLKLGDGEVMVVRLRRYSCTNCGKWHREFPDDILPHKHYPKTIIDRFNDGRLNETSKGFENYPVETTRARWERERKKNQSLYAKNKGG